MNMKTKLYFLLFCSLIINASYAQLLNSPQMQKSIDYVQELTNTITLVKKTSKISVIFPTMIPVDSSHANYFAYSDPSGLQTGKGYLINVDYTADCKGVHVCNVGYLQAEVAEQPTMLTDRANKIITQKVLLTRNIQGYYTPGHAMGSYFPPNLQWQDGNILFTLSWDDHTADRASMIAMANTAIIAGQW